MKNKVILTGIAKILIPIIAIVIFLMIVFFKKDAAAPQYICNTEYIDERILLICR